MGLFDFAGNIGKKLFGSRESNEDAAAKIKAEIDSAELGIQDLQVGFQDGMCSLSGVCPSAEAMQKADENGLKDEDVSPLERERLNKLRSEIKLSSR